MFRRIIPIWGLFFVWIGLGAGLMPRPTLGQTDEPDPRTLLETAINRADTATDISATFNATLNTTERVTLDGIFREQRTSQTEDGTAVFVADATGGGAYSFFTLIQHDAYQDSSSASTVASFQAEWSVRIINERIYTQAAYISGGNAFASLESGWRIIANPDDYPLQSIIDFGQVREQERPRLGLPDLLAMADRATEVSYLADPDDPSTTAMRLTFSNADAAAYLEQALLQDSANMIGNPILTAIVNDVRNNPANTTLLVELLRLNTEGYLIGRESTYNIVATDLSIGPLLPDEDPALRLNFNQTLVRDFTFSYNTNAPAIQAPDLAVTPIPYNETFSE